MWIIDKQAKFRKNKLKKLGKSCMLTLERARARNGVAQILLSIGKKGKEGL